VNSKEAANLANQDQWFRYWMPYHFQRLDDDKHKHVYLPVNRDYKPLGVTKRDEHLNYDDYRHQAVVFSRDPNTYTDVWVEGRQPLFLYNDGAGSRMDYFERLQRLMSRSKLLVKPKR